ncbi:IAA-alanine resistance protein 1 isoform X2 [Malania oleifera]|uniref:IAA-alanine resistance protein 1 isoform X2 n=1 Tax=Malania oleifera TaxID=397392 RepID=UPI0025AE3C8C|nr:IAA-alanine resistance protein 1 isoform X2 [Malania oleifera]
MWSPKSQILAVLIVAMMLGMCTGNEHLHSGSCAAGVPDAQAHHHCDHEHDHIHDTHNHEYHAHGQRQREGLIGFKLPEELAEEEDLKLYGLGFRNDHDHDHDHSHGHVSEPELSGVGLWVHAMGCSLLVSLASLICLIILPLIQGKPSKAVVDSLATFGAGAMLGDAFLHQLPHAFGGEHYHSHDHHQEHVDHLHLGHEHSHSHSLKDLSVGLSILAGIVLFLIVEKVVRYVEDVSGGTNMRGHSHHHHHHNKNGKRLKNDQDDHGNEAESLNDENRGALGMSPKEKVLDEASDDSLNGEKKTQYELLRKRNINAGGGDDKPGLDVANDSANNSKSLNEKEPAAQSPSSLVFGYLNLFSDGVHNFTDGMALGSAFLLYGSVGGWSRTVFLLAHELPQEVVWGIL